MNKSITIGLLVCALVVCSLAAKATTPPKNKSPYMNGFPTGNGKAQSTSSYDSISPPSTRSESEVQERSYDGFQNAYCQYDPSTMACPFREVVPVPQVGALPSTIVSALNAIKNKFNSYNPGGFHSGSYASVTYNGAQIWNYTFGTTGFDTTVKPSGNTIWRLASITKVFTAIAVYRLFQDGKIKSLDDPIVKYYPSFKIKSFVNDTKGPTIRQMLSHLSALPREVPCSIYDGSCFDSNADILNRLSTQYTYGPSNKVVSYSNLAFDLLGRLLESYMGTSWENYIQTKILTPLGMTNTYLVYDDSFYPQMAKGYGINYGYNEALYLDAGFANPAVNMYSTVNDMNKLLFEMNRAFAAIIPTKILNTDLWRQALQPVYVENDINTFFGTPFEMYPHSGYVIKTKSGVYEGYTSIIATVPELQLTMTIFWNSDDVDYRYYLLNAFDSLLPAAIQVLNSEIPLPTIPTTTGAKYVGFYNSSMDGVYAKISTVSGKPGVYSVYFSYGDAHYFMKATPDPTVFTFMPNPGEFTCGWYEYSGNPNIPAYFSYNNLGKPTVFNMPSAYYGIPFVKM